MRITIGTPGTMTIRVRVSVVSKGDLNINEYYSSNAGSNDCLNAKNNLEAPERGKNQHQQISRGRSIRNRRREG